MTDRRTLLTGLAATTCAGLAQAPAQAQLFGRGNRGPGLVQLPSPDMAAAQYASLTEWTYGRRPNVAKRIMRPTLTVQVITDEAAEVRDRASINAGVDMRTTFNVVGLDNTAIQRAVDGLYASLLARFTTAGYEFLPDEQVLAHPRARNLYRGGQASPSERDLAGGGKATFFSPGQDTILLHPSIDYGFGVLRQQLGGGTQSMDRYHALNDLRAGSVGVHLAVRFVDVQTWGGGQYSHLFTEGMGQIQSRAQVAFVPVRSALYAYPENPAAGFSIVSLKPMAALSPNSITAFEDVTTNARRVDALLGTAISALAGGSRTYERKDYRITVEPARFIEGLSSGGDALTAAFLANLSEPAASRR
jgi:hypothetical protein